MIKLLVCINVYIMQVKKNSTCTLNLGGRSLATLCPSLWLCDVKGDIYLLKNLEQYADSYASYTCNPNLL
jgi:hypothetical protein